MSSATSEFRRFLTYLRGQGAAEDVNRFANLVAANLDQLAEVGATRRARSTRLVPIAVLEFLTTSAQIEADAGQAQGPCKYLRLRQLVVGPFRGFTVPEVFDLSHDLTLVYGPNGTGKSSFCEALEAAMLGSISEARAKRLDHAAYCNNARLRRHTAPALTVSVGEAEPTRLIPDEAAFRFCFIEKNRLDDFSRIAARTPGDQRQLIATLFGIDQFSEFVRGFNQSLDESLALVGPKAQLLRQKREQLSAFEQTVRVHPERLAHLETTELALAERILPGQGVVAAMAWLLGASEQPGRLPVVQAAIDAESPQLHGVRVARQVELLDLKVAAQTAWENTSRQIAARASEVSFSQLYTAVLALSEGSTACPACGTELSAARHNPFYRAREGLKDLAALAGLQHQEGVQREVLGEALRVLRAQIQRAVASAAKVYPEQLVQAALPSLGEPPAANWLQDWHQGETSAWFRLLALAGQLEALDEESQRALGARAALIVERDRLNGFSLEVEHLKALRTALLTDLDVANEAIAQFSQANQELIQQVEAERPLTALNWRIKAAYDDFLVRLQGYLAALPNQLIQGLNEQAKQLYNAFNRQDHASELLHALRLPLVENARLEVEFAGEQGVRYDALVVLSEGHIRCLGLAILLAKNLAQDCPFVIFDDVVNAIDDEHRDGIWRTFFEDGYLEGKQVLLTSHAEEFLHRIQQELGAQRAGQIRRYKFLPRHGEPELRVDMDPPVKNYVLLADSAFRADEKRDALRYCRPALEALTDQLWRWLGKRGEGCLDLRMTGPRSNFELNNKCLKLKSAISRLEGQLPAVGPVIQALTVLLGVSGASIEWGYLNGGVHDAQRDHEFDGPTVQRIVGAVTAMDAALVALRGR